MLDLAQKVTILSHVSFRAVTNFVDAVSSRYVAGRFCCNGRLAACLIWYLVLIMRKFESMHLKPKPNNHHYSIMVQ